MVTTRILYRPVGQREMELISEADYRAYPPRLADQPIFYPVTNREYAESIAKNWNAPDASCGFAGYVTEFEMSVDYLAQFNEELVGSSICTELWVPAEQLPEFNSKIIGPIRVIDAFYGDGFTGSKAQFPLSQK